MMKSVNFILAGTGGQGILFVTRILSHCAMRKGLRVIGAETHGMAQRGGSVVSHVKLGDARSSLIRTGTADVLIALEENEAYRNIPFLRPGARMYANMSKVPFPRPEVERFLSERDIRARGIRAGDIAMSLGAPMCLNLTLLGFFSAFEQEPLSTLELKEAVSQESPGRFAEINLKAFDAGYRAGSGQG
jgi:indolepyruvate ferredoxin oxidoreductase, beta subunit